MLTLRLHKFRCWRSLELEFRLGQVYLLQGESGAGKSTVARAISWVLYGNVREIAPTLEPKADTTVELILQGQNNVRIVRQRPNHLWVIVTSDSSQSPSSQLSQPITYEDVAGQAIINDIFGPLDLWQTTAHLDPRGDNAFIRQSNAVKMNLLSTISFTDTDPLTIIEKLDPYLVALTAEYQSQLRSFQSTLAIYQTNHPNVDWNNLLSLEQIQSLQSQLTAAKIEQDKAIRLHTEYQVKSQQKQDLESRLARIIIPKLPEQLLSENLNLLNEYLNHVRIHQRLKLHLREYQDLGYTKNDLEVAQHATRLYQANFNLARSLNLEYSSEHLQARIQSLQSTLDAQPRLAQRRDLQAQSQSLLSNMTYVRTKLAKITQIKLPEITPREISPPNTSEYDNISVQERINALTEQRLNLTTKLDKLWASQDILQCPHCQNPLRYQDKCIVPADSPPVNPQELIQLQQTISNINRELGELATVLKFNSDKVLELNRKYSEDVRLEQLRVKQLIDQRTQAQAEINSRVELEVSLKTMTEQYELLSERLSHLPEINQQVLTDRDIQTLKNKLQQCLQVQIIDPPRVNPAIIEEFLLQQQRQQEYQALIAKHPQLIDVTEGQISADIQRLTRYHQEYQSALSTQKVIQQQLSGLILPEVPDINPIQAKITQLTLQLDLAQRTQRAFLDYQYLSQIQTLVNNLNHKLARTNTFKKWLIDNHANILQPVLAEINRELNAIITHLFRQSININLEMYKLTKTTQQLRQEVNFHINYKGSTSEGVKMLSDGETDRVVIATNLSLFKITNSPLLILDESVKMVGIDLKEKVIEMVRSVSQDRYVIIIGHDLIEGQFDVVYDMKAIGDNYEP